MFARVRETRDLLAGSLAAQVAAGALAILAVFTVIGLLVLWPGDDAASFEPTVSQDTVRGEVVSITSEGCALEAGFDCQRLSVAVKSGPDAGTKQNVTLAEDELVPEVDVGDEVRLQNLLAAGIDCSASDLSPEGLILAGIVIGALGVLDDVTISQASTVLALRGANPTQRF